VASLRGFGLQVWLALGVCLKVEIMRQTINHSQCSRRSLTVFVPAGVAITYLRPSASGNRPIAGSAPFRWALKSSHISGGLQMAFLAVLLSTSCYLALASVSEPVSTHVCDSRTAYRILVPILQFSGIFLDILIVIGSQAMIIGSSTSTASNNRAQDISVVFCVSGIMLVVAGLNPWISPQYRWWYGQQGSVIYMTQAVPFLACVALTTVCALITVSLEAWTTRSDQLTKLQLSWLGPVRTSSIIVFTSAYTTFARAAIRTHNEALSKISYTGIFFFLLACTTVVPGMGIKWQSTQPSAKSPDTAGKSTRVAVGFTLAATMLPVLLLMSASTTIRVHPIEAFLDAAVAKHQEWVSQASTSRSLREAARTYRLRYGRDPPPHFHHWYDYASSRNSLVIDDYDNIYNDLLPFWSLSPIEIKTRTWEMLAKPWNDIEFVKVRHGSVIYREGLPVSHQWMLNATADMIRPFAEWLPDMDIPLNLNDEPRVALHHTEMELVLDTARQMYATSAANFESSFSTSRDWKSLPEEPLAVSRFVERSWQPTWEEFGSIGCSSTSIARKHNAWDLSRLCTVCISQHTFLGYVSNWTAAADVCNQPDLAHLHGVYISPAAFKATHDLMPVFSQSRVNGYSDIRFPSPWNYVEEARYAPNSSYPDPIFEEKQNTFFWRGTTSEGFSAFGRGAWQEMTRQRLVWLLNNATSLSDFQANVLRTRDSDETAAKRVYYAEAITPSDLRDHLTTKIDVHFVKDIARCFGRDCDVQYEEFQPQYTSSIDFQDNWNYKYLMDVDGAGFSGRFIPFLHSHSLVFKAGIFREWWDGRVHAWKHFVPVDVRLMDLPGLLSYFGGWEDRKMTSDSQGTVEVLEKPHEVEAKLIAEQGREWAGKVLRKEDMEIYMFRLLLEWGRLTDARRDELGWRDDR
jgi:hypothetical protein